MSENTFFFKGLLKRVNESNFWKVALTTPLANYANRNFNLNVAQSHLIQSEKFFVGFFAVLKSEVSVSVEVTGSQYLTPSWTSKLKRQYSLSQCESQAAVRTPGKIFSTRTVKRSACSCLNCAPRVRIVQVAVSTSYWSGSVVSFPKK